MMFSSAQVHLADSAPFRRHTGPAVWSPVLAACALATLSLPAWAQAPSVSVLPQAGEALVLAQNTFVPRLQEVVITATRTEQPLSELVADMSVLDREAIERSGAASVADVLARLPGMEITRNGGPGNATSVFVRGAEGRFVAVYLDGVRLDSQSTGGVLWEQLPLSQIDRIEVLRGPAAAVYGSDALGGVIQLFTRKGSGAAAPYVGVGAGSHGTFKMEAGLSGSAGEGGAWDYALGVARERSRGYDARVGVEHNPDRDGYETTSGHARLGLRINAQHRLDASMLANNMESGYDISPAPTHDLNHNRLRAAGLTWTAQWTDTWSTRLSVTDSMSRYASSPSPYLSETQLRGYLWNNELRVGAQRFTLALERREDQLDNPALDAWSRAIAQGRSQNALALGYSVQSGAHTLQANLRRDQDSEFGGRSTGSVAYGYALTPQWRVSASAGTAFRAPTLYQRFSEYGDASLRPEASRNLEMALRYAQGDSSFSATAYRNRVRDLISFVGSGPCGAEYGCFANTARAEYAGLTLAAATRWAGVQWQGSLDFQNPRDLDTGKRLARRARQHASFSAQTDVAGWTMGAEWQLSGRRYDDAANRQALAGYGLVNLFASTTLAQEYDLVVRLDNAGNQPHVLAHSYADAGRTLYVGVQWRPGAARP